MMRVQLEAALNTPTMGTIGLIGGMSWESTAIYYRRLNILVRERLGGLHSAEILLRSLDFERVVALQKAGDWTGAADLIGGVAEQLVAAGAHSILICTNTMHLVSKAVAARIRVPLIDIIDETAATVRKAGCRRPLLLATAYTMEHGFYVSRMASHGLDVQIPEAADRAVVHSIIFDELCRGEVDHLSLTRLLDVIARGRAVGADSVILGCTEICLILDPGTLDCPAFDSTAIHSLAGVEHAFDHKISSLIRPTT